MMKLQMRVQDKTEKQEMVPGKIVPPDMSGEGKLWYADQYHIAEVNMLERQCLHPRPIFPYPFFIINKSWAMMKGWSMDMFLIMNLYWIMNTHWI